MNEEEKMADICQSCAMPLTGDAEEYRGTEADGSVNGDYCIYCYKDGAFTNPNETMEEAINFNVEHAEENQTGMGKEQMREYCEKIMPTLRRWKKVE